eukprot:jgi/Botrbrau1/23179/Bobra.0041s0030.2
MHTCVSLDGLLQHQPLVRTSVLCCPSRFAPFQRSQARHVLKRRGVARASSNSSDGKGPVVVVDNYDSFTYNLCQYLGDLECEFIVITNDQMSVDEVRSLRPRGILVSPGPGRPEDSGISLQIVRSWRPSVPLFGVCHGPPAALGRCSGAMWVRAPCGVMHGKTSLVHHNNSGLLKGLPNPFSAAR